MDVMGFRLPNFFGPLMDRIHFRQGVPSFPIMDEQEKKIRRLKLLVEVSLGGNIFIAGMLIFMTIIIFDKRLNILDALNKKPAQAADMMADSRSGEESTQTTPRIADSAQTPKHLIHEQVLSIDKVFNSDPVQIKLTVNGQLKKEVFGYLPYWVIDRADDINIKLLTSVAYFGLEVGPDGEIIKESADQKTQEAWSRWQNDKTLDDFIRKLKRNKTKVLLTFKAFNASNIEALLASPDAQKKFIANVLYQVSSKGLDGVNVDFEYVGSPTEGTRDKFSILMSNLNKELKRQYPKSVLSIATYASAATSTQLWDLPLLAENSDFLVIMGYDFTTPKSSAAGPVAPMGGAGNNLLNMTNAFLEKVDPQKIILAVPYYGYDFPVIERTPYSAVVPDQDAAAYPYAEIVEATKKTTIQWDEETQTPWYSYIDTQTRQPRVVHFENARSLGVKYDFVNKKNLGGIGIWALGFDGRNTDLLQLIADKFAH